MADPATAESLTIQNPVATGVYQHHRTKGLYQVIGMAHCSETLEEMVVYQDIGDKGLIWVRPARMFLEEVTHEGKRQPRFQWVGEPR